MVKILLLTMGFPHRGYCRVLAGARETGDLPLRGVVFFTRACKKTGAQFYAHPKNGTALYASASSIERYGTALSESASGRPWRSLP